MQFILPWTQHLRLNCVLLQTSENLREPHVPNAMNIQFGLIFAAMILSLR